MQKKIFTVIMVCLFSMLPIRFAAAADFDIHLHFYKVDGVTVGELSFGDQIAFRMHVATDAVPVMSMQRGPTSGKVSPDITNGMFMLRLNKD